MKTLILLVCLCGSVAFCFDKQFTIPIEQHSNLLSVLKQKQDVWMSKWGNGVIEGWEKYDSKFFTTSFELDYMTANLSFGTPPQQFNVLLSSGSTDVWVIGKSKKHPNGYDGTKSSTGNNRQFKNSILDYPFNATGDYYMDTMQFDSTKVEFQGFTVVDEIESLDDSTFPSKAQGILGLNHLPEEYGSSPMENILKSHKKKIFTLWLDNHQAPSKGPSKGQLTVAGYDTTHCSTMGTSVQLQLSNNRENPKYVFQLKIFYYNNARFDFHESASIDTLISTVLLPPELLYAIYQDVSPNYDFSTGLYTVPCGDAKNNTWINALTEGNEVPVIAIPARHYIVDLDLPNNQCALALSLNNDFNDQDIVFGSPLARSTCLTYDFERNQITFFPNKNVF